jgi:hypothetical protein
MPSFSLLPRDEKFFDLLLESSQNMQIAATKLTELMIDYTDVEKKVEDIKTIEHVGDDLIHDIMRRLHRTFVTPIDREDIALLGERIDDVVDAIEETARYMIDFHINTPTDSAIQMARIVSSSADELTKAVRMLNKRHSRLEDILPVTVEIHRLENEADQVASKALGALFSGGAEAIEVLKWREIYSSLELAADQTESAATVLEGIVLKNA